MINQLAGLFDRMVINKSLIVGMVGGSVSSFVTLMLDSKGLNQYHMYLFIMLLVIIVIDFLIGTRLANKNKKYESNIGIDAVIRNFIVILFCVVGYMADQVVSTGMLIFAIFTIAFLYHFSQSFIANIYVLGWDKYFPVWLFKFAQVEIEAKIKKYLERDEGNV